MLRGRKFSYSPRDYTNPFFQKKRRKVRRGNFNFRIIPGKRGLLALAIIVLVIGITWFFFFFNFFNIKYISTKGTERISSSEIESLVWQETANKRLISHEKNIFLFKKENLINAIEEKYGFKKITVNKKLPATIAINIEEPQYSVIWQENNKYYYIDNDGNILYETNPLNTGQKDYPLIENVGDAKVLEKKIGDSHKISYILGIFKKFNDDHIYEIDRFISDNDANSIKLALKGGPVILFNINEDIGKQISKLIILAGEKLKEDFKNKQYIDLRYGDRVYYK